MCVLRAYVLSWQPVLRANMATCLACLRTHLPICLACLCVHLITCQRVLRGHVKNVSTVFLSSKILVELSCIGMRKAYGITWKPEE